MAFMPPSFGPGPGPAWVNDHPDAYAHLGWAASRFRIGARASGTFTPSDFPILSVSRAGTDTAYARNSGGLLVPFQYYQPRITDLGFLPEPQHQNLLTFSEDLTNAAWSKMNCTAAINTGTAPNAAANANTITASAGTAFHYVHSAAGLTYSAQPYTFSTTLRRNNIDWCFLGVDDNNLSYFNLNTGAWGTVGSGVTTFQQQLANGWWRLGVARTMTAGASQAGAVGIANADGGGNFTAGGTEKLDVWGQMMDPNQARMLSYVPATSAPATQNPQFLTLALAMAPPFAYTVEAIQANRTGYYGYLVACEGVTPSQDWANMYAPPNTGASTVTARVEVGGVDQCSMGVASPAVGSDFKAAFSVNTNDFRAAVNGGAVSSDSSGTLPTLTTVTFGIDRAGSSGWADFIKETRLYQRALTNAELQAA